MPKLDDDNDGDDDVFGDGDDGTNDYDEAPATGTNDLLSAMKQDICASSPS